MSRPSNQGEFKKLVFNSLVKIPKGKVATYQAIASAIGRPNAARAVGQALNANPKLVINPCHRVIRSNGNLGGYRLGEAEKLKLLRSEGVLFNKANKIVDFKRLLLKIK
ncbi:MAG: MGMT family protein [Patescibacteria group bacterium]|nr:MGMT family protein [Patescibacteria group bacterium]